MGSVVVAVTGASSGVGRATAQAFAREGATVGLIARGQEALAATASEVQSLGGRPVVLECDVADPQALETAAGILEEHGEIGVWVNNAMASVFAPTWEITADEFRRVTEVTYLGVVYGTLCALSRMRSRDRGVIVQVGSALAYRGIPLQSPYCACKHAIQGFTESLRCELMHEGSGVRVTMVQLPAMNTPQFDTVRTRLPGTRSRCHRSISRRSPRGRSWPPPTSRRGESGGSARRPLSRCSAMRSLPASATAIWRRRGLTPSRPMSLCRRGGRTTCLRRFRASAQRTVTSISRPSRAACSGS